MSGGLERHLLLMWAAGVVGVAGGGLLGYVAARRVGTVVAVFAALYGAVGVFGTRLWVWWYRDLRPRITAEATWPATGGEAHVRQVARLGTGALVLSAGLAWFVDVQRHVETARGGSVSWWFWVITALTALGSAGGIVALRAVYLVARSFDERLEAGTAADDLVREFREVRRRLRGVLALFGVVLTLLMIALGAAANELINDPPEELVLLIGLALAALLALVYLPSQVRLAKTAESIVDHYLPLATPEAPARWAERLAARRALRAELGFGSGIVVAAEGAAIIFGPLATATANVLMTPI